MAQRVQGRLCVGTRGDLHESKVSFRHEEGAKGAVEVFYRSTQYLGQPLGAVLKLRETLRQGGERADFQQPIKLHRMRGRIGAVAGIHLDILGNVGWSANKRGPGCEVSHALFGASTALRNVPMDEVGRASHSSFPGRLAGRTCAAVLRRKRRGRRRPRPLGGLGPEN